MNVLVTGGAGFIGSHIVDKLISQGHRVVVVDNLLTGKKENVHPNAIFYQCSINSSEVEGVFAREKIDYVIHQAAQVDVGRSIQEPLLDAETNILGSVHLLELCRKYKVKKMVYGNSGGAGTGEPLYLPVDEGHPIQPLSPYGVSKHTVEHYLYVYAHLYGLRYTSLRYANVYGPRQDPFGEGGVVAIFAYKLLHDQTPTIYGDGEQTRDFVYVEDVAEANILALEKGDNTCLNVGTGKEISISELFRAMREISGVQVLPCYEKARPGDIKRSMLCCDKIKNALGWLPRTDLREGLRQTFKFFRP